MAKAKSSEGQERSVLANFGIDVKIQVEAMGAYFQSKGKTDEQSIFAEAAKRLEEAVAMNIELEKVLAEKNKKSVLKYPSAEATSK